MTRVVEPLTDLLREAVHDGVFPGAVLLVQEGETVHYCEAVGSSTLFPTPQAMTRDTLFDLASVTKPIATATSILLLIHRGILSLDDPVSKWLPAFCGEGKAPVTLFHLLNHSSGLPAWKPFYTAISPDEAGSADAKHRILGEVMQTPLTYPPGQRSIYSDLGFMLLGAIIEEASGQPLEQFCRDQIFTPLSMQETSFRPLDDSKLARRSIAATERCQWRERLIRGDVQDENCFALGGVSGHAGLFAPATDLARFIAALIAADHDDGRPPFQGVPQTLIERFLSRQSTPESSWGLGWDTPSASSSSGRHFSPRSFGHLGYSGSSIWVDRERGWGVILLTNRVHPTSRNVKISAFRPLIHDRIAETFFLKT